MDIRHETIVGVFVLAALAMFFYMSFQLGSFRLDLARYAPYRVRFQDVSGLTPKADIKMAGVKVGWVDDVKLLPESMTVELALKVLKEYHLYANAQAIVRQEGLLGVKFLELIPGDPRQEKIPAGGSLQLQTRQFVSMDEIFYTFKKIAQHVENLSTSFKDASLEAQSFLKSLKRRLGPLDDLLKNTSQSAAAIQSTAELLKNAVSGVSGAIEEARIPVQQLGALAQKINKGEGSLGELLLDTKTYEDVKSTAEYARGCVERVRKMAIVLDSHLEVLPNSYDHAKKTNVKWYFDARLFPCTQFFGLVGLVYSHWGFAHKKTALFDDTCRNFKFGKSDAFRLNAQAGVWIAPVAVRAGLIEGTAGVGVDVCMPTRHFSWLSTFEAFDFKGHNRLNNDRRPHLKWLNRFFVGSNFYVTLGADDFISKHNKSALVGVGAYFSSCDFWWGR